MRELLLFAEWADDDVVAPLPDEVECCEDEPVSREDELVAEDVVVVWE